MVDRSGERVDLSSQATLVLTLCVPKAIIELQTGVQQQTPLQWPFNQETNEEQTTLIRLSEPDPHAL